MYLSASHFFAVRAIVALGIGCCWLSCQLVFGATNEPISDPGWVSRAWGTEAGLPQNTVNAILQTRDGYLWLGTQAGLARFDGVRFKVYGLADGLRSMQIRALFEDSEGALWIGTVEGGVSRMKNGRIKTYTIEDGLTDNSVTSFAEDSMGRICMGTSGGVSLWKNEAFISNEALDKIKNYGVYRLLRQREGGIWISTIYDLFEFKDDRLTKITGPPGDEKVAAYSLVEDRQGNFWMSIGDGKILCRKKNGAWVRYGETAGVPYSYVTSMAEGADGAIWAGSLDAGLFYFKDEQFHPVPKQAGLSGDDIRSLFTDQEGNLWVGTRSSGLNRLVRRKLRVCGPAQGLAHDFVRGTAETADGVIWVATTGGSVYRGSLNAFSVVNDQIIQFHPQMESVLATRDGSVWWGGAWALFQWRDGKLASFYSPTNLPWLATMRVTSLCEDPRGGIWIGTDRSALLHYRDGKFQKITSRVAREAITSLASEPDGTLWIGSFAGGLSRLHGDRVENFSATNGLPNNYVRTLRLDRDGALWIGTGGAGLARWKQGRFDHFTTKQGLGDDMISQILDDDDGHLWLGCNRGIFRYKKSDLEALASGRSTFVHSRAYNIADGMPADECASGFSPAGLKLKSGQLCFATIKGLVVIDPHPQENDPHPPSVVLEEVMVDGQSQRIPVASETVPTPGASPPSVTIAPGPREIDFYYTGLNFAAPEKVQFRFRLDGWNQDWLEAGNRRVAYYQRLPPGNYVFRVAACNADGVWSDPGAALSVIVQPHFWETRWFLVLAVLSAMGLLARTFYLVAQYKYKRRLAQMETRHAIERERLRISQDMHDDIGGILTRVSILSDVGQSSADIEAAPKQFERIGAQVRAAVVALDEIVWATNPQDDNLPRFAEYVGRFADECFENTKIRCWQDIPTDLPKLPLRSDVRHNVFFAFKEVLNNVLKHSGATEVWLRLKLEHGQVILEIEDNGQGFNPEAPRPGGNGLSNMKSRLSESGGNAELHSAPGQGAKIRFVFPIPKSI